MYEQPTLQQPQVSTVDQYGIQSPIAGGQFDQSRQQYASAQQPQQAAGVTDQYGTQRVPQQQQFEQQKQQQALDAQRQQFGTQQASPSQQLAQPALAGQHSLGGASTVSSIPQQASLTQQIPSQFGQSVPSQQYGSAQKPVSGQFGQSIPTQTGQLQQIPVNPMGDASQQIPVEYRQQFGHTGQQSIEQTRQVVEMADTGVLADALARRLGLTSQQLAQVLPQLGMALGQSQSDVGQQRTGVQPGIQATPQQTLSPWLQQQ